MSRYAHLEPPVPRRYRLRNPGTGREVVIAAQPGVLYVDRDTHERLQVMAELLPLGGSSSRLPWALENLRVCPTCGELVQKDLNHCPYDGRRLPPLAPDTRSGAVGRAAKGVD